MSAKKVTRPRPVASMVSPVQLLADVVAMVKNEQTDDGDPVFHNKWAPDEIFVRHLREMDEYKNSCVTKFNTLLGQSVHGINEKQEIIEPVGLTLLYANHKIARTKSDSTRKPTCFYKFTEAKAKDCVLETDRLFFKGVWDESLARGQRALQRRSKVISQSTIDQRSRMTKNPPKEKKNDASRECRGSKRKRKQQQPIAPEKELQPPNEPKETTAGETDKQSKRKPCNSFKLQKPDEESSASSAKPPQPSKKPPSENEEAPETFPETFPDAFKMLQDAWRKQYCHLPFPSTVLSCFPFRQAQTSTPTPTPSSTRCHSAAPNAAPRIILVHTDIKE